MVDTVVGTNADGGPSAPDDPTGAQVADTSGPKPNAVSAEQDNAIDLADPTRTDVTTPAATNDRDARSASDEQTASTRGRPVTSSDGAKRDVVLGIDLGGTSIKWVVLERREGRHAVAGGGTVPTGAEQAAIIAALADVIRLAEERHGRVRAVGLGVPGHVDRATGTVKFLPNLPGDWNGVPLGPTLEAAAGRPVTLLNDARAFCLAELRLGAAQRHTDALFLTLGTGVGGGVVVGGELLVGLDDRLGEIGHLTYERGGPLCGCGNRGCLETYASAPALVSAANRPDASAADIVAEAEAGDAVALAVVERAGRAIGETVASLCAVLPANLLVIGGGVAAGLPVLRPHIEAALAERRSFIGPVSVAAAALGPDAGAIGAALTAGGSGMTATPANADASAVVGATDPAQTAGGADQTERDGGDRELDRASA